MKDSRWQLKAMLIVLVMLCHVLPAGSGAQEAVSEGTALVYTMEPSEVSDSELDQCAEGVDGQDTEIQETETVSLSATISTDYVKVLHRATEEATELTPMVAEKTVFAESLSEEGDGDEAADEFGLTATSGEEQSAVGEGSYIIYSNTSMFGIRALGNDLSSVQITINNGQVTSSNDHITWKFTEDNGSYLISFMDHDMPMYLCRSDSGRDLAITSDKSEAFTWTYENRKLKNNLDWYIRFNGSFSMTTNGQTELTDIYLARVAVPEPMAGVKVIICKTDLGGSGGTPLSGAEFILHGQHLVSGKAGYTAVIELPASSEPYVLTETKAPDGYMKSAPISVTVSTDGVIYTQENVNAGNVQTAERDTNGNYIIYVRDERGTELPMTGGTGTLLYTLSGLVLIVSAALMYGFGMRHRERRLVKRL